MTTLGLDMGNKGGLVVLTTSRVEGYLAQAKIALSLRRLSEAEFQETLRAAIRNHGIEVVAVEKVLDFGYRKVQASQEAYRRLTKAVCQECGVKLVEYPARTVKKFLTGRGNASKAEMIRWANKVIWFDRRVEDEHQADAGALALLAMQRKGDRQWR